MIFLNPFSQKNEHITQVNVISWDPKLNPCASDLSSAIVLRKHWRRASEGELG